MMVGVAVVIALGAYLPEHGFQLARGHPDSGYGVKVHSSISMPSCATSQPAALTAACSAERSSRTGLVLLIWTKMRRPILKFWRPAIEPSDPDIARWPMRAPVL